MKAIIKRELKAYFTSVIGWVFLAAFLFIFNLYFWVYNLNMAYAYISSALSGSAFVFLIIIPVLTMRSLAEERRTRTDQLLYTAPVSMQKIILGKFLAMALVFSIAIGVVCICPPVMSMFGEVPFGESYTAILGVWLFGLLAISIGLFLSAVTESQVIAAVLSFAVLFLGYMMDGIIGTVTSSENILTRIFGCLAIARPLNNFTGGVLDTAGMIYYLTATGLFLFLTCQLLQKFRWSVSSRKIRRGVFNSSFVVIGIAVVVAVNVLASQLPDSVKNIDVTGQKLYTLTDETYEVLDDLDQDITIYVLSTEDSADATLTKTLERYEDGSSHISVEYIDPAVSPNFYTTYTDTAPSQNSVIVVCGEVSRVIDYGDLYEYSVDYSTYTQTVDSYDGEGQLTSAIAYVTSGEIRKVYTVTGHGETALGDSFTQALEKLNLSVEELTLLTSDAVPEDAAAIIINGPTADFSEDDAAKVADYLAGGGKALITSSFEAVDAMPNFDSILAQYGLQIRQGMVMEGDLSRCYQYPFYLLPQVQSAEQTSRVDGYVMMLDAQPVLFTAEDSENLSCTSLMETSSSAYLKTDLAHLSTYEKEEGDEEGSFMIGANVTDSETGADLTVIGSVAAFNDQVDSYVSGQNLELFKGIAGGYSDTENAVSIDAKQYTYDSLSISQALIYSSAGILIIVIPAALLVCGIVIWFRRRKA